MINGLPRDHPINRRFRLDPNLLSAERLKAVKRRAAMAGEEYDCSKSAPEEMPAHRPETWSSDQDDHLADLYNLGITLERIAENLPDRSRSGVVARVRSLRDRGDSRFPPRGRGWKKA